MHAGGHRGRCPPSRSRAVPSTRAALPPPFACPTTPACPPPLLRACRKRRRDGGARKRRAARKGTAHDGRGHGTMGGATRAANDGGAKGVLAWRGATWAMGAARERSGGAKMRRRDPVRPQEIGRAHV